MFEKKHFATKGKYAHRQSTKRTKGANSNRSSFRHRGRGKSRERYRRNSRRATPSRVSSRNYTPPASPIERVRHRLKRPSSAPAKKEPREYHTHLPKSLSQQDLAYEAEPARCRLAKELYYKMKLQMSYQKGEHYYTNAYYRIEKVDPRDYAQPTTPTEEYAYPQYHCHYQQKQRYPSSLDEKDNEEHKKELDLLLQEVNREGIRENALRLINALSQ